MPAPAAVHVPVAAILATAARLPTAEALRHKRRGRWFSLSFADLAAESAQLATALEARGIGAEASVAVSGDYGPTLLLAALAAARRGARVVSVPATLPRAALLAWLAGHRVDLVLLGRREQLGVWRAALRGAAQSTAIVVDFHLPWGHPNTSDITAAADLLAGLAQGHDGAPTAVSVLWIEEGTDWQDGLAFILHGLADGAAIGFPESAAAAARDRRETQPDSFALSASHRSALAHDLAARLPAGNGLAGRWTRSVVASGGTSWHRRWLLARLRRPLGLARLRTLTIVGPDAPAPAADLIAAFGIAVVQAAPATTGAAAAALVAA